jgi:intermediate peptidase
LKIQCIENSERLVNEACQDSSQRTRIVAQIFDDLSDELCRVADMAEFVRLAHPDVKMAKAAEGIVAHTCSCFKAGFNSDFSLIIFLL